MQCVLPRRDRALERATRALERALEYVALLH